MSDTSAPAFWDALLAKAPGYSSDSRKVVKGDVFVALAGEKADGHDFVKDMLQRGASAAVIAKDKAASFGADARLMAVESVHEAHRALAAAARRRFKGRVVAVGGSSGKTTTKDFLFAMLKDAFKSVKTEKSQNGELGIPKTLEQLRAGVEVAVIEVGIDGPGDMIRHAGIVAPDMALLTSIGEEHLNLLHDIDTVFAEERILFDVTMKRGGPCFAPEADRWLRSMNGPGLTLTPSAPRGLRCTLTHPHALQNAALALEAARALGVSEDLLKKALLSLELPQGRGRRLDLRGDLVVIADHYNSNPSSLRAGLAFAAQLATSEGLPLRLVLGDMLDLGDGTDAAHDAIVAEIFGACPSEAVLIGPSMSRLKETLATRVTRVTAWADSRGAVGALPEILSHSGVVLVKGSRGMELEHFLEALKKAAAAS